MISFFRILFLLVFALFWGGLTFYTGFVVRISHDVLDDPMDGGLITQRVTDVLQILGAITFSFMACNALLTLRQSRNAGFWLFVVGGLFLSALVGLFIVHNHLDSVIDISASEVTDEAAFTIGHRRYNQLTTVQWLASLAYLAITLVAWRSIDTSDRSQGSGIRQYSKKVATQT